MDRKVAICTPIHRYTHADFTASLLKTFRAVKNSNNLAWLNMVGNANLAQARNVLVSEAIKKGVDDIVFIDSDIGWEPDAFAALFEHPPECQVIAGAPQRRDQEGVKFCGVLDDRKASTGRLLSGITATAFLRIQTSVFQKLTYAEAYQHGGGETRAWFDYVRYYNEEHNMSGFINEDYYFSMKCKEEGIENWIDPQIQLRHYNNVALTACMVDHI